MAWELWDFAEFLSGKRLFYQYFKGRIVRKFQVNWTCLPSLPMIPLLFESIRCSHGGSFCVRLSAIRLTKWPKKYNMTFVNMFTGRQFFVLQRFLFGTIIFKDDGVANDIGRQRSCLSLGQMGQRAQLFPNQAKQYNISLQTKVGRFDTLSNWEFSKIWILLLWCWPAVWATSTWAIPQLACDTWGRGAPLGMWSPCFLLCHE